jgi:hypothetical protein
MSLEQASLWLVGSILFTLGSIVLLCGLVFINNIVHKHWKPVTIFTRESFSIFSGHHNMSDNLYSVNQEEYDQLIKHLETIRLKKQTTEATK